MHQPLFEHRLPLDGVWTRALELEGDGPPLLLLHGFGDSADTWRPVLAELARQGRAALAVDLPGFGAADRLAREEPILPQLDRFAAAAVNHLASEHHGAGVVVAGNSLGGTLALRLAERDDLPCNGVVPIAPAGLDMARWFALLEGDRIVRLLLQAPAPPGVVRALVGEAYRQLAFSAPRAVAGEIVAAFCAHHASRRDVRRLIATGHRLLPEIAAPFAFENVELPVLLIWGTRDRMVSPSGADRVLAALPDAELVLLEGVGHCPQLEVPQRCCELIAGFAAGVVA